MLSINNMLTEAGVIKKIFLLATMLELTSMSSNAADLPRTSAPVYKPVAFVPSLSWTGFYAGVNGGGIGASWSAPGLKAAGIGALFGGTLGYNYQFQNNIVAGLEADLDWANPADRRSASKIIGVDPPQLSVRTARLHETYFGTARVRLGYSFGRFMPYITGGLAFAGQNLKYSDSLFPITNYSRSNSNLGWTIGAGVEAQIYQNWSAKLEYLYADLGKTNFALGTKISLRNNIVRLGVNYRF